MSAKIKLGISGLSCNHCKMKVEKALKTLAGVENVQVNLAAGEAEVDFDAAKISEAELKAVIVDAGYEVR
ncbi:MAG: heavy-metal-associated domain-containing protein [Dethiobacter sp.]|jgi:copper chaperone|nr:heavy-metal-associated domain-containing protein [Dethiobacter sp.]MBS3899608.1 heavy-metal-associated domain-containing protein [Dethiobacter sp.]MBS3983789.1 heavy-metal-associated domain-containing protein [Dethiobacter sp.]MCL4463710.1 copper ion binding protein [Bacillota bacterium]MCL5993362.1 copper ion binding protein [Bacillota bacterium]